MLIHSFLQKKNDIKNDVTDIRNFYFIFFIVNSLHFAKSLIPGIGIIFIFIVNPSFLRNLLSISETLFLYQVLFSQALTIHRTAWKVRGRSLSLSATFVRSQTLRYLFQTLQLKCMLRIFNRIACNYQTAIR